MHVGDPMSPDMQMGAIVSEEHLIKVLGDVAVAQQQGAINRGRWHPAFTPPALKAAIIWRQPS